MSLFINLTVHQKKYMEALQLKDLNKWCCTFLEKGEIGINLCSKPKRFGSPVRNFMGCPL